MCISANKGIKVSKFNKLFNKFEYFFGEDQGRYIIEVNKEKLKDVEKKLNENSIHYDLLGKVSGKYFEIMDEPKVTIDELKKLHTNWLNNYMVA